MGVVKLVDVAIIKVIVAEKLAVSKNIMANIVCDE